MVFIDFLLGGLLVYGLVRGIWNGFFVELASLLSLLIGIWAAIKFSHLMQSLISGHVAWHPKTIQIVAFALTFVLVVVGISLLAKVFTSIANFAGLGIFNKILGGFFGLLKMTLIISISLNLFAKLTDYGLIEKETGDASLFYNPIRKTAALVYPSLEEAFADLRKDE